MASIAKLLVELGMDPQGFNKGLDSAQSKLKSWGTSMRDVGRKATAGLTLPIVGAAAMAVNAASDLAEAQSAVSTVYGQSAKQILGFSGSVAKAIGLSRQEALSAAATLGVFGQSAGLAGNDLAMFSNDLLGAAADLGSFYNVPVPEALAAIQSGLMGEAEPLRKFGILLSDAAIKEYAVANGIAAAGAELTEQQKVLARQGFIMENLGAAQGDFARTSGGLANSSRILTAEIKDLAAQLGAVLLPYVQRGVNFLQKLTERLQTLSPQTRKWVVVIALAVAAIGPLLILIGTLLPGIAALGVVLGFLLSPIGLVVLAVAGLFLAWKTNFLGIRDAVEPVVARIKTFVEEFLAFFGILRDRGMNPFKAAFYAFWNALGRNVDWGAVGAAILAGVIAAFSWVISVGVPWLIEAGGRLIRAVWNGLQSVDWGALGALLWTGAQLAFAWIADSAVPWLLEKGGELLGALWDGAKGIDWGAVGATLWELAQTAFAWIAESAVPWLVERGQDLLAGLWRGATLAWDTIVVPGVQGIWTWITGYFANSRDWLYGAGADLMAGLIDGLASMWDSLTGWIDSIIGQFGRIPGLGNSPWPMMIAAGKDAMDGLRLGVEARLPGLERSIDGAVAAFSPGGFATARPIPALAGGSPGGGGGNTYTFNNHFSRGEGEDDRSFAERVAKFLMQQIEAVNAGAAPVPAT